MRSNRSHSEISSGSPKSACADSTPQRPQCPRSRPTKKKSLLFSIEAPNAHVTERRDGRYNIEMPMRKTTTMAFTDRPYHQFHQVPDAMVPNWIASIPCTINKPNAVLAPGRGRQTGVILEDARVQCSHGQKPRAGDEAAAGCHMQFTARAAPGSRRILSGNTGPTRLFVDVQLDSPSVDAAGGMMGDWY
jgi:hypothetical protein